MTPRTRRIVALLVLVLTASGLAGCAKAPSEDVADLLRAAIDKTRLQAHGYVLETSSEPLGPESAAFGRRQMVEAFIDDDVRYKVQLTVDGTPAYEEIAYDDALAVRVLSPRILDLMLRSPAASSDAITPLRAQQWVVDPVGAPDSSSPADAVATDPAFEAVAALKVLLDTVTNQPFVQFNPDDLQYDEKEDPFPKPPKDGPLARYDALPGRLPTFDEIEGTDGVRRLPGPEHFRKLSVYVRDGLIVEVRESVKIEHRARDLARLLTALDVEGDVPEATRIDRVRAEVNRRRRGESLPLLVDGTKTLRITQTGGVTVALPATAVTADLSLLGGRGRAAGESANADPRGSGS